MEGLRQLAHGIPPNPSLSGSRVPWQTRLRAITVHPRMDQARTFLQGPVTAALQEVLEEIQHQGLEAEITSEEDRAVLSVKYEGEIDFIYGVRLRGYETPSFAFPEFETRPDERRRYYRAEIYLRQGSQHYDVYGYTKEQIIGDVLSQYDRHMHFLHMAR